MTNAIDSDPASNDPIKNDSSVPSSSRRSFLGLSALGLSSFGLSAAASGALAFRVVTEPMLAHAFAHNISKSGIRIDANENPLGPSAAAREAAGAIVANGGRYCDWLTDDLTKTMAGAHGLAVEQVLIYPGSSEPLHHAVRVFASPQRSYVTADPGYEAGMFHAQAIGAKVIKVPLTKTYAHDVKAMIAAAPDAGVFYVCSPNNPTGTLTSHADIEYLLDHKPKDSIVVVDEAYIHFCDAPSVVDLVKAGKDLIVLRTFSKIYGMAGLRCGAAFGRTDLLEKLDKFGGWNAMPITALVAASASVKDAQLVPERKRINARVRGEVFAWLDSHGYSYIPSEANFFMLDTKRPAKTAIDAMATQNVFIGRIWPVMPTYSRVTIGTSSEMEEFQTAWQKVMSNAVTASASSRPVVSKRNLDGIVFRG